MRFPQLTYANVVSSLALFLALGGTSWAIARNSVGNRELKRNAVTSSKIRNGSVTAADLAVSAALQRGPRGLEGPAGPAGPPGIAASAEAWRALPLASGWTNIAAGHRDAQFRKDQLGLVRLRGIATFSPPPAGGGSTIGTLPEGYRPQAVEIFAVSDGGTSAVRVNVNSDGRVSLEGGGIATVGLSGIAFATD